MSSAHSIYLSIEKQILETEANQKEVEFSSPKRINAFRKNLMDAVCLELTDPNDPLRSYLLSTISNFEKNDITKSLFEMNCLYSVFELLAEKHKMPEKLKVVHILLPLFSDQSFLNNKLIGTLLENCELIFALRLQKSSLKNLNYSYLSTSVKKIWFTDSFLMRLKKFDSKKQVSEFIAKVISLMAALMRVFYKSFTFSEKVEENSIDFEPFAMKLVLRKKLLFFKNLMKCVDDSFTVFLNEWNAAKAQFKPSFSGLKEAIFSDPRLNGTETPEIILKNASNMLAKIVSMLTEETVQPVFRLVNYCLFFDFFLWKEMECDTVDHPMSIELSQLIASYLTEDMVELCLAFDSAGLMSRNRRLTYLNHQIKTIVRTVFAQVKTVGKNRF